MKDNRGLSLVELLVAIAISAIVTGSVAFLLVTSIRMYGRETTEVALQQELQVTLNQVVDYAMESQLLVLDNSDSDPDKHYLALGNADSVDKSKADLQIIWKEGNRLYLQKVEDLADFRNENAGETLNDKVKALVPTLTGSTSDTKYLLAENVDNFEVKPYGTSVIKDSENNDVYVYENPLSLDITIEFTMNSSGRTVSKRVSDKAVFRNHVKEKIYINGQDYTRKDLVALEEVTEYVDIEKAAATDASGKTVYTILDIAPSEAYAALPILAKEGFEYLDSYFQKPVSSGGLGLVSSATDSSGLPVWKCTAWEAFDAYANKRTGIPGNSASADDRLFDNKLFSNNGCSENMYAVYSNYNGKNDGYYKYVGKNQGLFAIQNKNSIEYSGYKYISESDSKKTEYNNVKYYRPYYTDSENYTKDYKKKTTTTIIYPKAGDAASGSVGSNDVGSGTGYRKQVLDTYYEYVGDGKQDYDFIVDIYNGKTGYEIGGYTIQGYNRVDEGKGGYSIVENVVGTGRGDYTKTTITGYEYVGENQDYYNIYDSTYVGINKGNYNKRSDGSYLYVGEGNGDYTIGTPQYTHWGRAGSYKQKTYEYYKYVGTGKGNITLSIISKVNGNYVQNKSAYYKRNPAKTDLKLTAVANKGKGNYRLVEKIKEEYFEYVGVGQGDYKIEFKLENDGSYDNIYRCYALDTDSIIKNVVMQSIYYKDASSSDGLDYGWVWVNEAHEPTKGSDFKYDDYKVGQVLALKNYWRCNVINNELLKLYVFQKDCEKYTEDGKIDVLHGVWDPSSNAYNAKNKAAVDAFDSNIKLNIIVKAPKDVTDSDISSADFILFEATNEGSADYNFKDFFSPFTKSTQTPTQYGEYNDLTFSQVLKIYDQVVCTKQTAIACPCIGMPEKKKESNTNVPLNIAKLWFMLYGTVDSSTTPAAVKALGEKDKTDYSGLDSVYDTNVSFTRVGSGRDIFKEFIAGYENDDDGYGYPSGIRTRNFVWLDSDGAFRINGTREGSNPMAPYFEADDPYDSYMNEEWGDGQNVEKTYKTMFVLTNILSGGSANLQMKGDQSYGSKTVYHHFTDNEGLHRIMFDSQYSGNYSFLNGITSGSSHSYNSDGSIASEGTIGVYLNQMLYSTTSNIFRFGDTGRQGSSPSILWIQKTINARDVVEPKINVYVSAAKDGKVIDRTWSKSDAKNKLIECNEFYEVADTIVSYTVECDYPVDSLVITDINTNATIKSFNPNARTFTDTVTLSTAGNTGVFGIRVQATCSKGKGKTDSDTIKIIVRDLFDLD